MTQPTAEQLEVTQADRDAAVEAEISRIKALFQHHEGDHEDVITYAKHVISLRQATEARMAAIEDALRPFAGMRKSTEPEVSDLLNRSPSEQLRRQAELTERRDREIDNARLALGKGSE